MQLIASYISIVMVVAVLDVLWLGVLMKSFYFNRLSHLLAPAFNLYASVAFYCVYAIGITFFAVYPAASLSVLIAALLGGLFGLIAYATYDLTNMATLRDWPLSITVVDILWGGFISGASAAVGWGVWRLIGGL